MLVYFAIGVIHNIYTIKIVNFLMRVILQITNEDLIKQIDNN